MRGLGSSARRRAGLPLQLGHEGIGADLQVQPVFQRDFQDAPDFFLQVFAHPQRPDVSRAAAVQQAQHLESRHRQGQDVGFRRAAVQAQRPAQAGAETVASPGPVPGDIRRSGTIRVSGPIRPAGEGRNSAGAGMAPPRRIWRAMSLSPGRTGARWRRFPNRRRPPVPPRKIPSKLNPGRPSTPGNSRWSAPGSRSRKPCPGRWTARSGSAVRGGPPACCRNAGRPWPRRGVFPFRGYRTSPAGRFPRWGRA